MHNLFAKPRQTGEREQCEEDVLVVAVGRAHPYSVDVTTSGWNSALCVPRGPSYDRMRDEQVGRCSGRASSAGSCVEEPHLQNRPGACSLYGITHTRYGDKQSDDLHELLDGRSTKIDPSPPPPHLQTRASCPPHAYAYSIAAVADRI
jgi:hypothetical protein